MFRARRFWRERDAAVADLEVAAAAAAARTAGAPLPAPRGLRGAASADAGAASLQQDPLRAPLLAAIPEEGLSDGSATGDGGEAPPVQALDDLPLCVQAYLGRAIRDGRPFKWVLGRASAGAWRRPARWMRWAGSSQPTRAVGCIRRRCDAGRRSWLKPLCCALLALSSAGCSLQAASPPLALAHTAPLPALPRLHSGCSRCSRRAG